MKGAGNSLNYKFRMHDPRLGRFLSIDPLAKEYSYYSPYAFSGNRVIDAIELEGLEKFEIRFRATKNGILAIVRLTDIDVKKGLRVTVDRANASKL